MGDTEKIWGLIAEFDEPEDLIEAAKSAKSEGYKDLDAFTPMPVHGLSEALGQKKTKLQWCILLGGISGGVGGFFMQYFANVIHFPWNVGGRPLNSWPSFVPVTFELTVLCAAFTAVIGLFLLNGMPEPYHPVFNVAEFEKASRDKFFLCIRSKDPKFELQNTKGYLQRIKAKAVYEVEP